MTAKNKPWVFISGGSRGIGAGIVNLLAKQGYRVVFTYRTSASEAELLQQQVIQSGGTCHAYQCDVSCQEQVSALSADLLSLYGAPYALINNAGITKDSLMVNMQTDDWTEVMSNNLSSVYLVNRAFLTEMVNAGEGCVIHLSSVTALKGNPGQVNYAATKAAMIGMTRSLAVELGRFNIRVNAIAPGLIETAMTNALSPAVNKKLVAKVPLGRLGSVEEVALAVDFLLGDGGRYISGQTLIIDGGMTA